MLYLYKNIYKFNNSFYTKNNSFYTKNNILNKNYFNKNNLSITIFDSNILEYEIVYFIISFIVVLLSDNLLCKLFNNKGRYFQLHSIINLYITIRISYDILDFFLDPINSHKLINDNINSYLIVSLHIYHIFISKNLTIIEYIHHILFVGLGVLPTIFYIKTNQIYLGYITCAGIPGVFEYGLLALYKKNKININTQKIIICYLYNYFRYPLAIYGCCVNYISWKYNYILNSENLYFSIYINILLFLNGSVFNHLSLKSYYLKINKND